MRYLTAVTLGFIGLFVCAFFASVQADNTGLEIASDSNFSSQTTNFTVGQTIYVRVSANNEGNDKHILNLRDNQYNLLSSYNLSKDGSKFTGSLSAPSTSGYYSLEAKIISTGSNSTSVKTIQVGDGGNSNVKVMVNENSSGQNTQSPKAEVKGNKDENPSADFVSPTPQSSPQTDVFREEPHEQSFWTPVFNVALKIADFLWPF